MNMSLKIQLFLTLYVGTIAGVLSHFQASIGGFSSLQKVQHTFIIDL